MRKITRINVDSWSGLNLNSPKSMLRADECAFLQNFLTRHGGSLSLRPGYAKMRHGSPVVVTALVNSDNFNRTDTVLAASSDWSDVPGTANAYPFEITDDSVIFAGSLGTAVAGVAAWVGDVIAEDQYAEVTLSSPVNHGFMGIGVRNQNGSLGGGINFGVRGFTGNTADLRVWADSVLGSMPYVFNNGDRIRLQIAGDEIRCFLNDAQIFKVFDSTRSGGEPYIFSYGFVGGFLVVGKMDDFECGTVTRDAKAGIKVPGVPSRAFHFERDDGSVLLVVAYSGKFDAFEIGDVEWSS